MTKDERELRDAYAEIGSDLVNTITAVDKLGLSPLDALAYMRPADTNPTLDLIRWCAGHDEARDRLLELVSDLRS